MVAGQSKLNKAREEIEGVDTKRSTKSDSSTPPAGPHAKEATTNKDATPGAGSLPPTRPAKAIEPGTG